MSHHRVNRAYRAGGTFVRDVGETQRVRPRARVGQPEWSGGVDLGIWRARLAEFVMDVASRPSTHP